jgi:molecular chaperone DnaK (HSP70)
MSRRQKGPVTLGIDFGTTHTVVALADRGNYPAVSFEGGDFVPSLVAVRRSNGEVRHGSAAAEVAESEEWAILRSLKRLLAGAGPQTTISAGGYTYCLADLLTGYFTSLKNEIYSRSNAGLSKRDLADVAVSVPANAMSDQRFLTLDAYRRAGFRVSSVLNEPSAAGFEYANRHRRTISRRREHVLVYDLGGGTFDAALIRMSEDKNEVIVAAGAQRLGGDDFDEAILSLVLEEIGAYAPGEKERADILEECRRSKEAVVPATKRFIVDLETIGRPPLVLPVEKVFAACGHLVEQTIAAMEPITSLLDAGEGGLGWEGVAGVYAVGGASRFPAVYRRLRDLFGRQRVHRSPYPFAATAMGLAVFMDKEKGYTLQDRLARNFGVWRERDDGRGVCFDVIFASGTPLPQQPDESLEVTRRYRPVHNIGHFRFVECSRVQGGEPGGDMLPWGSIFFPFAPGLRGEEMLAASKVLRSGEEGPEVLEKYCCTGQGTVTVTIEVDDGYRETFTIPPR